MSDQLDLFTEAAPVTGRSARTLVRTTDPVTSAIAAYGQRSRNTHLRSLLHAYAAHRDLTDVEAAGHAGLDRVEATRRASELRSAGLIEPIHDRSGRLVTRLLPTGRPGMVCRITAAGAEVIR